MKKYLRGISVVGLSQIFQTGGAFLRGVILARLLSVHEFGYAVIIITITASLDMFADAGIDRFIVQHPFGYRSDVMSTSHAYRVVGSGLIGLAVATLSYPIALIFKAPEMWAPIAATGGIVCLRGLIDLDYKLPQRDHNFLEEAKIDTARTVTDLLCAALVAIYFHTYLAVLAGVYANALTHLLWSHLRHTKGYSFRPRERLVRLVGRFSIPIYINAAMLFMAMQGDRMVVGAVYSKRDLALYTVSCTVGQGLVTTMSKVLERVLLPVIAKAGRSEEQRRRTVTRIGFGVLVAAGAFLTFVWIVVPRAVPLIYGAPYKGLSSLIAAAAIFQMIQILQSFMSAVLIGQGATRNFPFITGMRATAFPAAILFASLGLSLVSIPLAFALGASASLATAFWAAKPLRILDAKFPIAAMALIGATFTLLALGFAPH